ncbi:hypothetical protein A2V68_01385 [candidate division Kazan bacterium RBG_13_50_9]|uniref:Glutamyl-tRNA amidotransferase n=1 Tax=candidate division Kazan bacterium RBG_13_50_9 TaxID=1798535 RepID=A0A1F4NSI6_UNCK3|nr:MAG: hypothetical protein A2V68_01385 [candidate division Kazan bacterium RBG_13_50_9]
MSFKETVQTELTTALKARDEIKVSTLRLLVSALHNEEIAKGKGGELGDADSQAVVKREVKKRKEAIEGFKSAGREESAAREEAEMKILEAYLPAMMSEEEITKLVDEEIAGNPGANQGQIIGAVMKRAGGLAEGNIVGQIVGQKLAGK